MDLHDEVTLSCSEVAHLFRHNHEITDIQRLQFCLVKAIAHANEERPFEHGNVFIHGMPVSRNLRAIGAADADNKWSFGVEVTRHRREIAAFDDGYPLQIPRVYDLMSIRLLAISTK